MSPQVLGPLLAASGPDGPAGLLPAREQMALSLGWHIILACFGVAFPTMIYVVDPRELAVVLQFGQPVAERT